MEASPAVEIDSEGKSAGIELERVEDTYEIVDPFDPKEIDVTTEQRTLDTLLKRLSLNQIDLDPDFQRARGIWSQAKKSLLIESLLLRIPLPTFYVAETDASETELGEDQWSVVDGIQRLSTLAEFVDPSCIGLDDTFELTDLQYLTSAEGSTFSQLTSALQLRILESQFTFQVIRKTTPEPVKLNIFARINTGGVPLSAQELRHALTPGQARNILKDFAASEDFQNAVAHSVSDSRMADREMVLRFLAFRMTDPQSYQLNDFNEFLRSSMKAINAWDERQYSLAESDFATAMNYSVQIFGDDAFRKRYRRTDPRRPVSKALFEAVAVAIATVGEIRGAVGLDHLVSNRERVLDGFMTLMSQDDFDRSISQGTGNPPRVRTRFGEVLSLLLSESE